MFSRLLLRGLFPRRSNAERLRTNIRLNGGLTNSSFPGGTNVAINYSLKEPDFGVRETSTPRDDSRTFNFASPLRARCRVATMSLGTVETTPKPCGWRRYSVSLTAVSSG